MGLARHSSSSSTGRSSGKASSSSSSCAEPVERRMARPKALNLNNPVEMTNKRKEVDVAEEDEVGGGYETSEKRSKLSVSISCERQEGLAEVRASVEESDAVRSSSLLHTVQRILEAHRPKRVRPLPVLLGDKVVDLLALNVRVSSMGGYSKVTEAGLWGGISDALGLGLDCGPGLKLVYVKYLKALERGKSPSVPFEPRSSSRMDTRIPSSSEPETILGRPESRVSDVSEPAAETEADHENGDCCHAERLEQQRFPSEGGMSRDKESESRSGATSLSDGDTSGDQQGRPEFLEQCTQALTSGDWMATYASGNHLARNPNGRGNDGNGSDGGADTSDDWYEGQIEESREKQREALSGMLYWIRRVALSPGTLSAGLGSESSGQNEDWVSQCKMLTSKVRSVLWKEQRAGDGYMQAKQIPSFYYDELIRPDSQTLERLRVTRERLAYYGFQSLPGPSNRGATSSHQERIDGSYWGPSGPQSAQRSTRQPVSYSELANPRYQYSERIPRKRIPIGPDFQADSIPCFSPNAFQSHGSTTIQDDLAGDGTHSDDEDVNHTRWLGVRIWPLPGSSGVVNLDRIGRGRPPTCDCIDPDSIDCVRLHIEVEREDLKIELGQAFYDMGFDQMGECVANQWSKEEEQAFRLLARTNPASLDKNFWDHLPLAFPSRTKKELVSYYFNVFVLRRRALQNRLEGQKIDSDDDEAELPDESDESDFASMDEDEEEDDPSEGADDAISEDMADPYPLKLSDDMRLGSLGPLSGYNYSSTGEISLHGGGSDRAVVTGGLEEAGNHSRLDNADSSHIVLGWDHKHMEAGNLVRDVVLQQGRHWEEPQWDVRDHQQVDTVLSEAVSSRQASPPPGKEDTRHSTGLGELWNQHMEMAPKREKDRLLSTNGMILELFGDDVRN